MVDPHANGVYLAGDVSNPEVFEHASDRSLFPGRTQINVSCVGFQANFLKGMLGDVNAFLRCQVIIFYKLKPQHLEVILIAPEHLEAERAPVNLHRLVVPSIQRNALTSGDALNKR